MKKANSTYLQTLTHSLTCSWKTLTACFLLVAMVYLPYPLEACQGTPVPPCGRSVFVAKFTPGVVVFPAAAGPAGAINVPIGVLPFAFWNTRGLPQAPICPQPISARLTLTLTCFPSGTVIQMNVPNIVTPTTPGAQPLAGGPVNFTIPAGTFAANAGPQICLVVGTYNVTFSDGVVLTFNGDTEVCLVEPSPLDTLKPRLEMEYLSPDGSLYQTCRRGDQANMYFLIANNDPVHSVDLSLNSIGRQVAQLPEGFTPQNAYSRNVYAISNPNRGTDAFAASFTDELMPGELLPEPDPEVIDDQSLSRSLTLLPCEAIIVGITMRSYGMCANGSCNERLVKVEGTFSNGDPALACASTLLVVDDAPAKTILCEYFDSVKVNGNGQAQWSPGTFTDQNGPIPHAQSFSIGNLPPDPTGTGFRTVGELLQDSFPSAASDYIRLDREPTGVQYQVGFNSPRCGDGFNVVNIQGLNQPIVDLNAVPVISFPGITSPVQLNFNLALNELQIVIQGEVFYQGPIDLFFADPPPDFCIDPDICRVFRKDGDFNAKAIFTVPQARSRLFLVPDDDPGCDTLNVSDQMGLPANWNATISGTGLILPASSGLGALEYCYDDLNNLPLVPATTIAYVEVLCPGAINDGLFVPVAIRIKQDTTISTQEPVPVASVLHPPAPNPFTDQTIFRCSLTERTLLSLDIFSPLGQHVRQLVSPQMTAAGEHRFTWDGTGHSGDRLPPGLYICRMKADGVVMTQMMVRM